jgi:hypothetical protein
VSFGRTTFGFETGEANVAPAKEEQRPIRILVAQVEAPDLLPLSDRLARALLPVALRQRLEGLVPGPERNAVLDEASRVPHLPPL